MPKDYAWDNQKKNACSQRYLSRLNFIVQISEVQHQATE
jgi:hypothetical protein